MVNVFNELIVSDVSAEDQLIHSCFRKLTILTMMAILSSEALLREKIK